MARGILTKAQRLDWFAQACKIVEAYPHRLVDDQSRDKKAWAHHNRSYVLMTKGGLMDCRVSLEGDWCGRWWCRFHDEALALQALKTTEVVEAAREWRRLKPLGFWTWHGGRTPDAASWSLTDFGFALRTIMPLRPYALEAAASLQATHQAQLAMIDLHLSAPAGKAAA